MSNTPSASSQWGYGTSIERVRKTILDAGLGDHRETNIQNDDFHALCPIHLDSTPSLHVTYKRSEGIVLLNCFGCGATATDLAAALKLNLTDLYDQAPQPVRHSTPARRASNVVPITKPKSGPLPPLVDTKNPENHTCDLQETTTYTYFNAEGEGIQEVLRYQCECGKKSFKQRFHNGKNWVNRKPANFNVTLYNLPDILQGSPKETIYFCEGEKDADTLTEAGFIATTLPGGAKNIPTQALAPLQSRKVSIICDNDKPGIERGRTLKRILPQAQLLLPAVKHLKADATDHFTAELGINDFITLHSEKDFTAAEENIADQEHKKQLQTAREQLHYWQNQNHQGNARRWQQEINNLTGTTPQPTTPKSTPTAKTRDTSEEKSTEVANAFFQSNNYFLHTDLKDAPPGIWQTENQIDYKQITSLDLRIKSIYLSEAPGMRDVSKLIEKTALNTGNANPKRPILYYGLTYTDPQTGTLAPEWPVPAASWAKPEKLYGTELTNLIADRFLTDAYLPNTATQIAKLREAVLKLSGNPVRHEIHRAIGWTQRDGQWAYTHGLGRISSDDYELLPPDLQNHSASREDLNKYTLLNPKDYPDVKELWENGTNLFLKAGPDRVTFPLMGQILTSAIHRNKYSQVVVGVPGSGKTGIVAAAMQHQGLSFGYQKPPTLSLNDSGSTKLSAQKTLSIIYNAVGFCDDGTPGENVKRSTDRLSALIQTAFNQDRRQTLTRERESRSDDPVNASLIITSEFPPSDGAAARRSLLIPVHKDELILHPKHEAALTKVSEPEHAKSCNALFAHFIQWLAKDFINHYETWTKELKEFQTNNREAFGIDPASAGGHLYAGWILFAQFLTEKSALSPTEAQALLTQTYEAITQALENNANTDFADSRAQKYLDLIKHALENGKCGHLLNEHFELPQHQALSEEAFGWVKTWRSVDPSSHGYEPKGKHYGYIKSRSNEIWLTKESLQAIIKDASHSISGNPCLDNSETIARTLAETGILKTFQEKGRTRYSAHRKLEGLGKRRFYILDIDQLFFSNPDEDNTPSTPAPPQPPITPKNTPTPEQKTPSKNKQQKIEETQAPLTEIKKVNPSTHSEANQGLIPPKKLKEETMNIKRYAAAYLDDENIIFPDGTTIKREECTVNKIPFIVSSLMNKTPLTDNGITIDLSVPVRTSINPETKKEEIHRSDAGTIILSNQAWNEIKLSLPEEKDIEELTQKGDPKKITELFKQTNKNNNLHEFLAWEMIPSSFSEEDANQLLKDIEKTTSLFTNALEAGNTWEACMTPNTELYDTIWQDLKPLINKTEITHPWIQLCNPENRYTDHIFITPKTLLPAEIQATDPLETLRRIQRFSELLSSQFYKNANIVGLDLMKKIRLPKNAATWFEPYQAGKNLQTQNTAEAADRRQANLNLGKDISWARPIQKHEENHYIHAYDQNSAYVSACSALQLPIGKPTHIKNPEFNPKIPGLWFIGHPENHTQNFTDEEKHQNLPPLIELGWATTADIELAKEKDAFPDEAIIHSAYIWPENARILNAWYTRLRTARLSAQETGDQAVIDMIKACYTRSIGMFNRPGNAFYFPERRTFIVNKAKTSLLRTIYKNSEKTPNTPLLAAYIDSIIYVSKDPNPVTAWPGEQGKLANTFGAFKPEVSAKLTPELMKEIQSIQAEKPRSAAAEIKKLIRTNTILDTGV